MTDGQECSNTSLSKMEFKLNIFLRKSAYALLKLRISFSQREIKVFS